LLQTQTILQEEKADELIRIQNDSGHITIVEEEHSLQRKNLKQTAETTSEFKTTQRVSNPSSAKTLPLIYNPTIN